MPSNGRLGTTRLPSQRCTGSKAADCVAGGTRAESGSIAAYHAHMANHPDIASLEFLLGTWNGEGVGIYPTIDDFSYREEISFVAPPGKPFLHYSQKTWRADGHREAGTPLHTECGYIRPVEGGGAELVIAQPSGIVEVHSGTVEDTSVRFTSDLVARTRTAKEVTSVDRTIVVQGDQLSYEMWMGAVGQPHQVHLKATLHRMP